MEKIWKSIKGFEGYYEISNTGVVRSIRRVIKRKDGQFRLHKSRVLKHSLDGNGYKQVVLMKNNIPKTIKIHRLVAVAFIPNPEKFNVINHINAKITDNSVKNLEWCTLSYNTLHSYKLGRMPIHGETHDKAILTLKQVREIRKKYVPRKYTLKKLGDEYGVTEWAIGLIIRNKNWKHDK